MGVKVENLTIESARELVSNLALWPLVRDFLWDFAPQVHPSWLEGVEALKHLENPRVKRYILASLGVEPCFHVFPKEDGSRILLLEGETLESVAMWLGALVCADALRRVTDGATVRKLKSELPGIYPEVFGYTAYFGDFAARNAEDAKNAEEILARGLVVLASAVSSVPELLFSRLRYKFPKKLCDLCVPCGERESTRSALQTVLKLLKLKFPEAYKLCCS